MNIPDHQNCYPILEVAERLIEDNYDLFFKVLEHVADVNVQNEDGDTCVHLALPTFKNPKKLIRLLTKKKFDWNLKNKKGQTALHLVQYIDAVVQVLPWKDIDTSIVDPTDGNNNVLHKLPIYWHVRPVEAGTLILSAVFTIHSFIGKQSGTECQELSRKDADDDCRHQGQL